jgi:hypothetical protein
MAGTANADTGVNIRHQNGAQTNPDSPPAENGSRPAKRDQSALILALGGVQCRGTISKFVPIYIGGYGAHKVDAGSDIPPDKKNDLNPMVGITLAGDDNWIRAVANSLRLPLTKTGRFSDATA